MDEMILTMLGGVGVTGIIAVMAFCEFRVVRAYRHVNARLADDLTKSNEQLQRATMRNVKANQEIRALEDALREKDKRIQALQTIATQAVVAMETMESK